MGGELAHEFKQLCSSARVTTTRRSALRLPNATRSRKCLTQWDKVTRTCKSFSNFEESLRVRMRIRLLLFCLLLTSVFGLPAKKEKRERRMKQGTSSCTREVCARARSTLKVNGDCVKTPFCVRSGRIKTIDKSEEYLLMTIN